MEELDVLVVGAGPTGLTAAALLAASGVRFRIIDKLPERSEKSRALVVHARTLELLQKLDLADSLIERGQPSMRFNLYVKGRRATHVQLGDIGMEDTPFPFLLFVSQAETEALLEDHLRQSGVSVERSVELLEVEQDDDGVTAKVRGPAGEERIRARYLIGCDGAHSLVRKAAGLSFEGAPYPQEFLLADAELTWDLTPNEIHLFLGREGILIVFPLKGRSHYRVMASRLADEIEGAPPTAEEFETLAREIGGHPLTIDRAHWLSRFRLHHRGVDRYRAGRIFVAGDAAHIHSPAGGQGMNTGIQDAWNLAWKLAEVVKGHAPDALLDSYHDERWPVGQRLLHFTDRIFSVSASRNPLITAARNFAAPRIIPRVLARPERRAWAFRFISQLGIRYRDSAAVYDARQSDEGRAPPCAGDRAPDAPGDDAAGAPSTLFEALRGVTHHLVAFTSRKGGGLEAAARELAVLCAGHETEVSPLLVATDASAPIEVELPASSGGGTRRVPVFGDTRGEARRRYAVEARESAAFDALLLIRPDGYIGCRADETRSVRDHLERWFDESD